MISYYYCFREEWRTTSSVAGENERQGYWASQTNLHKVSSKIIYTAEKNQSCQLMYVIERVYLIENCILTSWF